MKGCYYQTCFRKHNTEGYCKYHFGKLMKYYLLGVFNGMKRRCQNPKSPNYKYYGARGIKIYKKWLENPIAFYKWSIKNGWKRGLQIDRKNNDGNYVPTNCRFVTSKENNNNKGARKEKPKSCPSCKQYLKRKRVKPQVKK